MPNRREFLQAAFGSSAVLSLGVASPSFLLEASHAAEQTNQQTVLVIVQMSGGNDGLNTVIPYGDDAYRKSRPTLAVSPSDVLKINDQLGFHPSLRGFAGLLEAGTGGGPGGNRLPQPESIAFRVDGYLAHVPTERESANNRLVGAVLGRVAFSERSRCDGGPPVRRNSRWRWPPTQSVCRRSAR